MQKGCEMNPKEAAKRNDEKTLKAIKTFPKMEGYYVVSFAELAKKVGVRRGSMPHIIKRLERKDLIEVKESYALFGTLHKRGIKINIPLIKRERG